MERGPKRIWGGNWESASQHAAQLGIFVQGARAEPAKGAAMTAMKAKAAMQAMKAKAAAEPAKGAAMIHSRALRWLSGCLCLHGFHSYEGGLA